MFYQSILKDRSPYIARLGVLGNFGEHRHGDIEINYCLEGSFTVIIDKKSFHVNAGQFSLVGPMVAHEYRNDMNIKRKVLTIIVGISFLKKHFTQFSKIPVSTPVFTLDSSILSHQKLVELFCETATLCADKNDRRELLIQGNLYKICDYLIEITNSSEPVKSSDNKDLRKVENIEKALDLIYYNYSEDITVDDAAAVSGYGKSNFCKVFKNITGDTFHNILNKQRIEAACSLLSETNMQISEIALQVGLSEPKTFCRVFKSVMGVTPGTYRKKNIHNQDLI